MLEMLRMLFISTVSILSQMLSETGENKEEAQFSLVPKELLDLLNVVVRKAELRDHLSDPLEASD